MSNPQVLDNAYVSWPSSFSQYLTSNVSYLLVRSWLNCMLMLEIVLIVRYFQHSSRPLLSRVEVAAIFALGAVCTFAVYMFFCCYSSASVNSILRTLVVILLSTYATASLEQLLCVTSTLPCGYLAALLPSDWPSPAQKIG